MVQIPDFVQPSWLNDQDANTIHARMMAQLPRDIDTTEGGFPWDFTMPTALEKAEALEFHLVETLKIMHPMWAYGEWLDLHAQSVGLERKSANAASCNLTVIGIAGTKIPLGFRFAVPAVDGNPATEFVSTELKHIEESGTAIVSVVAVIPGQSGNVSAGTITLMSVPIKGITSVTNNEEATGGTEEESDDDLRERIMEVSMSAEASFSGCDSDYKRWAKEVVGVGDAYVVPEGDVNVPNSVKLIVIDGNGAPANEQILQSVYKHIISPDDRMMRKAPIGAILTVAAPDVKTLNYSVDLILESGQSESAIILVFAEALLKYYTKARSENVIRYTQVSAILTNIPGVVDFENLTINGDTENIALEDDEYPMTGQIN
jgi:uncharacterized phage protein gp47/JayE